MTEGSNCQTPIGVNFKFSKMSDCFCFSQPEWLKWRWIWHIPASETFWYQPLVEEIDFVQKRL
jgi:hypothetical protein